MKVINKKGQLDRSPVVWPRAIILVDMNAFFASIEQRDRPQWQGKPVAITNGEQGTCIITCSYEARAYGVHTGMRLREARRLCPDLIQCPADPKRYARVSQEIMRALHDITPDVEVFSVDEAFLDVTRCQKLHGTPLRIARMVRDKVFEVSGIYCSIGVSGDKTTAKFAAKLEKPNGLTVIPPWDAEQRLQEVPVTELCGIARGIGDFLAQYGVRKCGEMKQIPISVLARRFGNQGRRIWHMCQGTDPSKVSIDTQPPKSMGHGKVMPPNTTDADVVETYLLHMCEKLATRLRRHGMQAGRFFIGLRAKSGWIGGKYQSEIAVNDGSEIMKLCHDMLNTHWYGEAVYQVQVTALNPRIANHQIELFSAKVEAHGREVNVVMDQVNDRYGEFTLTPMRLMKRSSMPNVIAPAWRPEGVRQTV